eukprot:14106976-Heterocapsa_arctica.AAC.1
MAVEDEGVINVNCMAEVIEVNALDTNNGVLLLVDSKACISTCPRTWCDWAPTSSGAMPCAVTATGAALKMYGRRRVFCTTWEDENFDLTFIVSDVSRPNCCSRRSTRSRFHPRLPCPRCASAARTTTAFGH